MNKVDETLNILKKASETHDAVLVAYSGGKDSRAVLDLCLRSFKRVECFYMYILPHLRCIEEQLEWATRRFGVTIHQYPNWLTRKFIVQGNFCNSHIRNEELPEWKLHDVYGLAMAETGIPLIATGAKRADSLWRRRMLKGWGDRADVIYPIVGWSLFDVQAYLRARDIPLPDSDGRQASGVDLSTAALLWLHDKYPDDFQRVLEVFPYAEAVVWRRKWYGVTGDAGKKRKHE
jgi:3'-phosphoadenosine 5'-phosphosulfate sulfotransferase (PAPS reductase)/FAD synthetase